jgi:hypothetical protein
VIYAFFIKERQVHTSFFGAIFPRLAGNHSGFVWETEDSSGCKRIEGDFGKF